MYIIDKMVGYVKSRSFFYTILKYSLAMLIVPVLMTVLLYFYVENIMRDHIQVSSENTLNQFFALVDKDVSDLRDTCVSIGDDREFQKYAQYGKSDSDQLGFQAYLVQQELYEYRNNKLAELVVFYPHIDRVISDVNGALTTQEYLKAHSWEMGGYETTFRQVLECESKQPVLMRVDTQDGEYLLCMVMRKRYIGDPQQDFVIALILDERYCLELMACDNLGDDGTLMIFDKHQNLLISGDGRDHYRIGDYDGTSALYDLETEKGTYIMQIKPAQGMEGYYGYATDTAQFWRTLSELRFYCFLGIVLCIAISIVMALRSTRHVFNPIKGVVKKIEKSGTLSYNQREHNELEFIERILEINSDEKRKFKAIEQKGEMAQRDRFVRALLAADEATVETALSDIHKYGLTVKSNRYLVALILVQKRQNMDVDMQGFVFQNVLEEVSDSCGWGALVELAINEYALLVNFAEDVETSQLLQNLYDCQVYLSERLGLDFVIAVGDVHRGFMNIHCSFEEAQLALRYKYLMSDSRFISYSDIRDREFSYASQMESSLSRKIVSYIDEQDNSIPEEQFVAEIMNMCSISEESSLDNVECFKYEMISIINKAAMICGENESRKGYLEELVSQPSLKLFQEKLVSTLKQLRGRGHSRTRQDRICMGCMRYIHENYGNPQLSITALGDEFKMAPYYVSQLFKSKYGVSVPDYITKIRIRMAKEDLLSSTKSIKDIAEENGFVNSNVFIRHFKKSEGITPGEFRRNRE